MYKFLVVVELKTKLIIIIKYTAINRLFLRKYNEIN